MEFPNVSVIIVNYNGRPYLEKCLSSILANNYPRSKYEIILVDNKSNDGSVEFVENRFTGINIVRMAKNLGYVGGVNVGEKYAKGEYLVVLNNDISVDENWLIELVKSLNNDETLEICTSKTLLMNNPSILDGVGSTNNIIGQGWSAEMGRKDEGQYEEPYEVSHPSGCSFIIRRRVIKKFEYFLDPDFFMWQDDLDLGWRARLLGLKVLYSPKSVAFHKGGGSSKVSPFTYYFFYRNMLTTFYQNLADENLKKVLFLVLINVTVSHVYACIREMNAEYLMNIFRILEYFRKNRKKLSEKREKTQKVRKCSDEEIFFLFAPLIIVPKGVKKYGFMPQLFLKLINLYIALVRIPVAKFKGLYYY